MPPPDDKLDLHGLTVEEAIRVFVEQYNQRVKSGHLGCWTIVHGYGSSGEGGAIRGRLRELLSSQGTRLRYEPGDDYGNPGWTWVYPQLPLPERQDRLATEIIAFCSVPKASEKIIAKFARHGEMQVRDVVRLLAKHGRIRVVSKGMKAVYLAD